MTRDEWLDRMRSDHARLTLLLANPGQPLAEPSDEWIPSQSPFSEAFDLVNDCTDADGVLHREAVINAVCRLVSARNKYMARLGLLWPLLFARRS